MGPVPKWGLYFYWGRGITRVVFNRPLYPAHVDASDSEFQKLLLVSVLVLSWRAFHRGLFLSLVVVLTTLSS